MQFIKSLIFCIILTIWALIFPIIFFPVFFLKTKTLADKGAKLWSVTSLWLLKLLCGIDYIVKGMDKLPKDGSFIIACKHYSMWETMIMTIIFDSPAYIYKKELLNIPIYGWYIRKMTSIAINREGGRKSLVRMVKQAKECLSANHNIIIFPQGTRVSLGSKVKEHPYQSGIAALYKVGGFKVVPTALNSGLYWKKGVITKKPGTIILEFLDPVESNLEKKEFMNSLEKSIETATNELIKVSK